MKVVVDLFSDEPKVVLRFENFDNLCSFLVGFWEMLDDE